MVQAVNFKEVEITFSNKTKMLEVMDYFKTKTHQAIFLVVVLNRIKEEGKAQMRHSFQIQTHYFLNLKDSRIINQIKLANLKCKWVCLINLGSKTIKTQILHLSHFSQVGNLDKFPNNNSSR
jgi:hypothetical protein